MNQSARQTAERVSFQTFLNCFLREIEPGVWHPRQRWEQQTGLQFAADETEVLELQLDGINITLAIGANYHSRVGRHRFTQVFQQQANPFLWQPIDSLSAIMLLINAIYSSANNKQLKSPRLELMARTIESHQVMAQYLEARLGDPRLHAPGFLASEQSLLSGHWFHPTPKSRQGILTWQHARYSPELCAQFQLHGFAVDRSLVRQGSILPQNAESIIEKMMASDPASQKKLGALAQDKVLLPLHPLQAQWLLHQDYVQALLTSGQMLDIGPLGPQFSPTSSVRTLFSEQLDFMIKLSIPVKITNSLRINMQHELNAGMVVAKLLKKTDFSGRYPQFKTIDDPAYITVQLPGMEETGFEVIIRENPLHRAGHNQRDNRDQRIESIAALTQESLTADRSRLAALIIDIAERDSQSLEQVSRQWFDAYWHCAVEPAIRLYDECGIALEAHQQNSLLDISNGYPDCYYYRDNQGFYLSSDQKATLLALEPDLTQTHDLFYDDAMIRDRFSYYLVINQLFSVINRLALDGLITEDELLHRSRNKLQRLLSQLKGSGAEFVASLLSRRDIPCKGNLLTRAQDVDELQAELEQAVYTRIANPLRQTSKTDSATVQLDCPAQLPDHPPTGILSRGAA